MSKFTIYLRIVLAVVCALILVALDVAKLSLGGAIFSGIFTALILICLVPPALKASRS